MTSEPVYRLVPTSEWAVKDVDGRLVASGGVLRPVPITLLTFTAQRGGVQYPRPTRRQVVEARRRRRRLDRWRRSTLGRLHARARRVWWRVRPLRVGLAEVRRPGSQEPFNHICEW